MKITRISQLTGKIHTLELDVTENQMNRFDNRRETGEYLQDIFSNLSAPQREFILTGITPKEWESNFQFNSQI